jgi:hypothetical protein
LGAALFFRRDTRRLYFAAGLVSTGADDVAGAAGVGASFHQGAFVAAAGADVVDGFLPAGPQWCPRQLLAVLFSAGTELMYGSSQCRRPRTITLTSVSPVGSTTVTVSWSPGLSSLMGEFASQRLKKTFGPGLVRTAEEISTGSVIGPDGPDS